MAAAGAAAPAAAVDVFVPIQPCRVYDTRADQDLVPGGALDNDAPSVAHFNQRTALIAGHPDRCAAIDAAATAVAINVLVINPQTRGFLSMYPEDSGFDGSSFMNFAYWAGDVANPVDAEFALQVGGVMALDDDGEVAFFWQATKSPPDVANPVIDVAIDVTGYFIGLEAGTGLVASGNGLAIDTPYQLPQANCTDGEVVTSDGLGGWACESALGGGGAGFDKTDVYVNNQGGSAPAADSVFDRTVACNDANDIALSGYCNTTGTDTVLMIGQNATNFDNTGAAATFTCNFKLDGSNGNGQARIVCVNVP
jgi:hypothetical protein